MKYLIFDSGPLINFSLNGLLPLFKKIKKEFGGEFLITPAVKKETIDYPETVKRFELEALQLKELFKEGIIKLPELTKQQSEELERITNELINIANSTYSAKGKNIELIDKGEATTLALSIILKNSQNAIVIDERTTRMLCESPENLRKLFEKKLHTKVIAKEQNYSFFKGFRVIRSTELVYLAHKKGLVELKDPHTLDALLYAMKFNGCSISENEIEEMKEL
jgi:hypothetical protein